MVPPAIPELILIPSAGAVATVVWFSIFEMSLPEIVYAPTEELTAIADVGETVAGLLFTTPLIVLPNMVTAPVLFAFNSIPDMEAVT